MPKLYQESARMKGHKLEEKHFLFSFGPFLASTVEHMTSWFESVLACKHSLDEETFLTRLHRSTFLFSLATAQTVFRLRKQ